MSEDNETLKQFADYVSADIKDGRTSSAIALKRIRRGLKQEGQQALKEVLVNVVSLNLHIEKRLSDSLLESNSLVDEQGNLVPAISKDLLKLRQNTLQYLKMLQAMEGKSKGNQETGIAELIDD